MTSIPYQTKKRNRQTPNQQVFDDFFYRDPGGTQTHDLQNRNLTLYSTKLPGQMRGKCKHNLLVSQPLSGFIFV